MFLRKLTQLASSRLFSTNTLLKPILPKWTNNAFSTAPAVSSKKQSVMVTYIKADGTRLEATGKDGDNLLDIAVNNNLDLSGYGACEGTLACSTCHLIFKKQDFDRLEEQATDEELDMLDLAYGLTDTSRLGCQVCMNKELDGLEVNVPEGVSDVRER